MSIAESDAFKMSKSEVPQSIQSYTPFSSESWAYVNDKNNATYSAAGQCLVQFDLTSIASQRKFLSVDDLYVTVPLVYVGQFVDANGQGIHPVVGGGAGQTSLGQLGAAANLLTLKNGFHSIVHQAELSMNGKVIQEATPLLNLYKGFRLISEMCANDLKTSAQTLGVAENGVDNPQSVFYNNTLNAPTVLASTSFSCSGGGFTNNRPCGPTNAVSTPWQGTHNNQNWLCANEALNRRMSRIVDSTGSAANGVYSSTGIMSASQLSEDIKAYSTLLNANLTSTVGANYITYYDTAILPLKFIFDAIDKMPMMKNTAIVLRLYLNTGSCIVPVHPDGQAGIVQYYGPQSNNFIGTTCPFTLNYISNNIPLTTNAIACGLFIGKASTTNLSVTYVPGCMDGAVAAFSSSAVSANLGLSNASHPMTACRCYYRLLELDPLHEEKYLTANTDKSVVFEDFRTQIYNSVPAGGSFSQIVTSKIKAPVAVVVIPLLSTSNVGVSGTGTLNYWPQYSSPFDQCGGTSFSPCSLTNFQVSLGGVNMFETSLQYGWENFIEQVSMFDNLTGNNLDVLTRGVTNQQIWDMNRVYVCNLTRGDPSDRLTPRNLKVSFKNNCRVAIDAHIFTVFLDEIRVDVRTGLIR